jgi:hypothetical protein
MGPIVLNPKTAYARLTYTRATPEPQPVSWLKKTSLGLQTGLQGHFINHFTWLGWLVAAPPPSILRGQAKKIGF